MKYFYDYLMNALILINLLTVKHNQWLMDYPWTLIQDEKGFKNGKENKHLNL